jgi:hypothetical protein
MTTTTTELTTTGPGHTDVVRGASLSGGAADGALIGLVIGLIFGIATVWPVAVAAVAGGALVGAAWGAALAYLRQASGSG